MSEVLGSKCWVFENRHCGNNCSQQQPTGIFHSRAGSLIKVWKVLLLGLGLGRWLEMLDLVSINITLTAII